MKIPRSLVAIGVLTGFLAVNVIAQPAKNTLSGQWMLELEQPGGALVGLLEINNKDDRIQGFVEGGPIDVSIQGQSIELKIDSRDAGARRFERILTGTLKKGAGGQWQMQGTYLSTAIGSEKMAPRAWRAEPYSENDASPAKNIAPKPVDLSGIWNPGTGIDMRKYSMDLTEKAQQWVAGYDPNMDQPPLRCLSPGLVQLFGYVYPLEIVHAKDRIFIINEGYGQVRQIYLDGREPPDYYPQSRLGFSVGHWEGSTLVVETTKVQANIRDFRGEPMSDNVRVVERYSLSEDGQQLSGVMKIYDPENYRQPAIRRVVRRRTADTVILPYECDPDSFFRQLYENDKLDEYWSRRDKRL